MSGFEQMIIVGNLGRDPEMRYTQDGTPVTNLSVAVNNKWKTQDGETRESVKWFRVSVWGPQGEAANQYLSKGRQVQVVGTLVHDPENGGPKVYKKSDGTYGASFELRARNVLFLGGRQDGDAPAQDDDGDSIPF